MSGSVVRAHNKREGVVFRASLDEDGAPATGDAAAAPQPEPEPEPAIAPEPEPAPRPEPIPEPESVPEPEPIPNPEPELRKQAIDDKEEPTGTSRRPAATEPTEPAEPAEPEIVVEPVEQAAASVHTERPVSPQEAAAAARNSSHAFVQVETAPAGTVGATLFGPLWAATAQKLTRQAAEKADAQAARGETAQTADGSADTSSGAEDDEGILHLEAQPVPEEPDGAFEVAARRIAEFFNSRRTKGEADGTATPPSSEQAPAGDDLPNPTAEEKPALNASDGANDDALPAGVSNENGGPALPSAADAATNAAALPPAAEAAEGDQAAALPAGDEPPGATVTPALATGTWRDNAFGRFVNRLLAALGALFARLGAFIAARWRHFRENPGPIRTAVKNWFSRVAGAAHEGSFSSQPEEYASGRSQRDFICNILGTASFGALFPLLTVVVTQIVGVELAGMFSLSFVAGSLFLIIANFGMRPYQVSDINEEHSFADYRVHRFCTCLIMAAVGLAYCAFRGYSGTMLFISLGVYGYKLIEGMADAYEGRLQQKDKLYLAGISQTIRSVGAFIVFTVVLLISHNLAAACIALPITGLVTFFGFTFPLAKLETPKSRPFKVERVVDLFKQCTPLFVSLFLYTLIDYMPVFVMEGVLSYDNQLYYNAMYFPAQAIAVGLSVVYKPQLLRIANYWNDKAHRRHFDVVTIAIFVLIALVTALVTLIMSWIGVPIMSFMYGLDFEPYRELMIIFLIAGGVTSFIDFLYQITAVLRSQQKIMQNYLITFGFSLFVPTLLVNFTGLPGAVIGYLIVMCILLVLTGTEYVRIRIAIAQEEADEAAQVAQFEEQQRRRWASRFRTKR